MHTPTHKHNRTLPHHPYDEYGKGPTIILVPGLDGTALLFYRQVPLLGSRFHVLTFPLPDDPQCTMDSLVDNLRRLIEEAVEQKGHKRVLLCGESFGGALCLSFALAYPQLLTGMVIVNSFPVIRRRLRLSLAPRLLKIVPWAAMPLVRRFTESRLHSPHTLAVDLAEFHDRTRAIGRDGYIRRLEILRTYDVRHQLGRIRTPTLFLAGDLDHLVPSVKEARFMASALPNASVKVLRGYGHVCLINHDFNLLDHITPWLDSLPR